MEVKLELTVVKDNKCFYKYVNKRRSKENLHLYWKQRGGIVTKDEEKAEIFNTS